jgi:hypothetical protein
VVLDQVSVNVIGEEAVWSTSKQAQHVEAIVSDVSLHPVSQLLITACHAATI